MIEIAIHFPDGRCVSEKFDWELKDHYFRKLMRESLLTGKIKRRKKQPGVPYIKTEKGYPYWYVATGPKQRMAVHRLNWEKAHGPIPPGYSIHFLDKNTLNCDLDNLELLSGKDVVDRIRDLENQGIAIKRFNQSPEGKASLKRRSEHMKKLYADGSFPVKERSEKMRQKYKEGLISNPFTRLDDKVVAYQLFPHNPELAQEALKYPDLINAQRQKTLLKRAIKKLLKDESAT